MDLDSRRFFCSELVAKIFKDSKLLKTEVPSGKFLPGTFSSTNSKLQLEQDAWFGEEEMIVFDEDDIKRLI